MNSQSTETPKENEQCSILKKFISTQIGLMDMKLEELRRELKSIGVQIETIEHIRDRTIQDRQNIFSKHNINFD